MNIREMNEDIRCQFDEIMNDNKYIKIYFNYCLDMFNAMYDVGVGISVDIGHKWPTQPKSTAMDYVIIKELIPYFWKLRHYGYSTSLVGISEDTVYPLKLATIKLDYE